MKKMWKISVCALAATFTFSALTACDKGEQEEKSNITAEQVLALGDSIQESLSDVQSFSFGLSMKTGQTARGYLSETGMSLTALANVKEDDFDAKITGTMYDKMDIQGMPEYGYNETDTLTAYVVDGFSYRQDEDDETGKTYIKSSRPFLDSLLEELSEGVEINMSDALEEIMASQGEIVMPEIPVDLIKTILTDEFTLVQKGDTTRVTLDMKKELNDMLGYVGNLSVHTKVGDVINYALGHIDEELTWQDITSAIKGLRGYTVGTLISVMDAELYNASGMRLQEIKDMIFAEQSVYDALVQELGTEAADAIVNTTVADVVTQYSTVTIDQMLQQIAEDSTLTLTSVVDTIETALNTMTLGDSMDEEEKASFSQVISVFKGIRFDDLNANLIFTVKNDRLTRVEVSYNVKATVTMEGDSMSIYVNSSVFAENFSAAAQTIALPTGSTVDIYCESCGWAVTEDDYCSLCRAYVCDDDYCHFGAAHNG